MDISNTVQTASPSRRALVENPIFPSHDALPCTPPQSLSPLLELLHSFTELAFIAGVLLGTLGFLIASLLWMLPGEDWSRLGKSVASNTFIGMVLLLSANMIVGFLTSQLGGAIC